MTRYAAFLRAVNLGPTRKVSSAQLREEFAAAGFDDVATFRTSGNVVFSTGKAAEKTLIAKIEEQLKKSLGFEVPIFLRSEKEMAKLAAAQPFKPATVEKSKGKLQVVLLSTKPSAAMKKEVLAHATEQDALDFGDRELYWLPSGGTLDSDLDLKAIAKILGGLSTMRTKGTVDLIEQKFFQND